MSQMGQTRTCSDSRPNVRFAPQLQTYRIIVRMSEKCQEPTYAVQHSERCYSIISSAVAISDWGTVRPNILAVWWLMTSSNLDA